MEGAPNQITGAPVNNRCSALRNLAVAFKSREVEAASVWSAASESRLVVKD